MEVSVYCAIVCKPAYRFRNVMDAEIICDICHKKFTNKFSLNRPVKTIHEKKEDFICMKCQKNFKEMHHLKRHQQKCRRCGAQLDSLTAFAKHFCKRKQAENQKIPTKKARNSYRKWNYTGDPRAKNRKEFEVLENQYLDEEDPKLREFLSKYWSSIRTFFQNMEKCRVYIIFIFEILNT